MNLTIDNEFKAIIPPLAEEERTQLEANLVADGCREPLAVWNGTIVDGHNRYEICTRLNIPFATHEMSFADRDEAKAWIIRNQFGRRNLNPYVRAELALKLEEIFREKAKANQKAAGGDRKALWQNSAKALPVHTRDALADIAGVSHDTIGKVRKIVEKADEETKQQLREGTKSVHQAFKETTGYVRARDRKKAGDVATPKQRNAIEELTERLYKMVQKPILEVSIIELRKVVDSLRAAVARTFSQ